MNHVGILLSAFFHSLAALVNFLRTHRSRTRAGSVVPPYHRVGNRVIAIAGGPGGTFESPHVTTQEET